MTDWPLVPPGLWLGIDRAPFDAPMPALFLDRDGVIVDDVGYLSDPAQVRLVTGIGDLIGAANAAGIPVVVATNQSGVDRGLMGWDAFAAVQAEIARRLAAAGARMDAVVACPFHPDFTPGYGRDHAKWRKPAPGMLDLAAERLNLDKSGSWLIGDQKRDIEAAREAGCAGAVHLTRVAASERPADSPDQPFRMACCSTVAEAMAIVGEALSMGR